eukprot:Blabericola_migrator_1__9807@NODE_538_length_7751_cov_175_552837_g386_i1_p9_GENE_NODE_538_length_7751_cov_175_552837_g386_i1NODE_538_length_7751_cov_175_552837_g386_i1_p9_ORF_typecomplete_len108_score4_81_NODE_538_length_7751_cov_175_552837_g386_i111321455
MVPKICQKLALLSVMECFCSYDRAAGQCAISTRDKTCPDSHAVCCVYVDCVMPVIFGIHLMIVDHRLQAVELALILAVHLPLNFILRSGNCIHKLEVASEERLINWI